MYGMYQYLPDGSNICHCESFNLKHFTGNNHPEHSRDLQFMEGENTPATYVV